MKNKSRTTLKSIVNQLKARGHRVSYVVRSDGSIRITRIDGERFKANASTGNLRARAMLGYGLSTRKTQQLERQRAGIAKRRGAGRPKLEPLSKELRRAIRNAQRAIRKDKPEGKETVQTKTIREHLKLFGERETLSHLKSLTRYYQGYAYEKNTALLAARIRITAEGATRMGADGDRLLPLADWCEANIAVFREAWIVPLRDALYDIDLYCRLKMPPNEINGQIEYYVRLFRSVTGS